MRRALEMNQVREKEEERGERRAGDRVMRDEGGRGRGRRVHMCVMHVSCVCHACVMCVSCVCHACVVRVSCVCHACVVRVRTSS